MVMVKMGNIQFLAKISMILIQKARSGPFPLKIKYRHELYLIADSTDTLRSGINPLDLFL